MYFVIKWSGWGPLVIPLMLLGLVFGVVVQEMFGGTPMITDSGWVIGFLISAILIRTIGRRLNRYDDVHTLYDVPLQHWWWLGLACAVLTLGLVILVRA